MNEIFLRKSLNLILKHEPNSIKAYVAKEALQRKNIKDFFVSIAKRGCISGIISSLNYYEQTHPFFDQYYDEIERLRVNAQKQTGTPVKIPYDLKTSLSWFAFEQTARNLADELGMDSTF